MAKSKQLESVLAEAVAEAAPSLSESDVAVAGGAAAEAQPEVAVAGGAAEAQATNEAAEAAVAAVAVVEDTRPRFRVVSQYGFPLHDSSQGITFTADEAKPAELNNWVKSQIEAKLIAQE
jgi:hypothetical protein